jgi:hypothetical protein
VIERRKMEGYCSTGQSPQRAVVPMEEEKEEVVFCSYSETFLPWNVKGLLPP